MAEHKKDSIAFILYIIKINDFPELASRDKSYLLCFGVDGGGLYPAASVNNGAAMNFEQSFHT